MTDREEIGPGVRLGDTYELVAPIGKGGMGTVWQARHLRLSGKQVAIKVLRSPTEALSAEALARFRREAEVASRINHPNIVQVLDYQTLPTGTPYLVMELLSGESLAQRLRRGPLPLEQALAVARQVGSALAAAHREGVVHRDLKPDNVFLVPEAEAPFGTRARVLDFGISKIRGGGTLATQDAVLVGTPQYMSPEQALGKNSEVDARTDVFALGAIAYEMIAGQPAFSSEAVAQVLFQVAYQPHVPLAERVPLVPANVSAAIERALEKDAGRRFPDVGAFVEQLTGSPLATPVPSPPAATAALATPETSTPSVLFGQTQSGAGPAAPGGPTPSVLYGQTQSSSGGSAAVPLAPVPAPSSRARWVLAGVGLAGVVGLSVWLLSGPGPMTAGSASGTAAPVSSPPLARADATVQVEPAAQAGALGAPGSTGERASAPDAAFPSPELAQAGPLAPPVDQPGRRVRFEATLSREQRARLDEAEAALLGDRLDEAERLGRSLLTDVPEMADGPVRALLLEVACARKDLGEARSRFAKVPRPQRHKALRFCRAQGLQLF